jgi:hypothetical protein
MFGRRNAGGGYSKYEMRIWSFADSSLLFYRKVNGRIISTPNKQELSKPGLILWQDS